MLFKIPHIIQKPIEKGSRSAIGASVCKSIRNIGTDVIYAVLPITLATIYNEARAGAIVSIANFITLIMVPIVAWFIDQNGAIKTMRVSNILFMIAGLFLILMSYNIIPNTIAIRLFIITMFVGYGFNAIKVYILQITPKDQWWTIFGIFESITAGGSFVATLLIPRFEHQALRRAGGLLILVATVNYVGTHFLQKPSCKKVDRPTLNVLSNIKHGLHFIKKNNYYPIFDLITGMFDSIFYASIWFLIPLLIAQSEASFLSSISLGVYEIITMLLGGVFGRMADKYNRKSIYILWRIIIIVGIGLFVVPAVNPFVMLTVWWILIGIGDNLIYWWSSHILEETDQDHQEDSAFVAIQRITSNIGYILMPALLGIIIKSYSIHTWFVVLGAILVAIALGGIYYAHKKS